MKLNLVLLLLLALCMLNAKFAVKKSHMMSDDEEEEAGSGEEGEEGEEGGADLSNDVIVEYRILGKGTFGVHNAEDNEDDEDDTVSLRGELVHFPNYCKQ